MASRISINVTNGIFSNFALARKQLELSYPFRDNNSNDVMVESKQLGLKVPLKVDRDTISFNDNLKFQKSGITTLIGAVALIVFSNFLNPSFSNFAFITGLTMLGASAISTLREPFAKASEDQICFLVKNN